MKFNSDDAQDPPIKTWKLEFLFKLKNMINLKMDCSTNAETVQRVLEELLVLSEFSFKHVKNSVDIEIDHQKRFQISVDFRKNTVSDVNSVFRFIFADK